MTEDVNTGGLKEFRYPKGWKQKRDIQTEEEIKEAYEKYYAKRKKRRLIGLIITIIILIAGYFFFKK